MLYFNGIGPRRDHKGKCQFTANQEAQLHCQTGQLVEEFHLTRRMLSSWYSIAFKATWSMSSGKLIGTRHPRALIYRGSRQSSQSERIGKSNVHKVWLLGQRKIVHAADHCMRHQASQRYRTIKCLIHQQRSCIITSEIMLYLAKTGKRVCRSS